MGDDKSLIAELMMDGEEGGWGKKDGKKTPPEKKCAKSESEGGTYHSFDI